MSQPINIGLAGLGRAGWGMHCKELRGREEKFRIVAACDPIASRRERMEEHYGCRTYEHVEDLIADGEVELVDIATRSTEHHAHTMAALQAEKHVFLEKPMCISHDQAVELQQADAQSEGSLYIRHNRRFDSDFVHVKEIIDSGMLGEVYEIRLARHGYSRRDDWQTIKEHGGGQLLNWGPHIVDHALRFVDGQVAEQFSYLRRVAAVGDAEDHVKIVLRGVSGRIVDLEISGGVAIGSPTYLVFGTKGSLTLSGREIRMRYLDPAQQLVDKAANPGTPGETFGTPEQLEWIDETIPVNPGSNSVIWDELYSAIREGTIFPISLDEAVQVMQVISAAKAGTEF